MNPMERAAKRAKVEKTRCLGWRWNNFHPIAPVSLRVFSAELQHLVCKESSAGSDYAMQPRGDPSHPTLPNAEGRNSKNAYWNRKPIPPVHPHARSVVGASRR